MRINAIMFGAERTYFDLERLVFTNSVSLSEKIHGRTIQKKIVKNFGAAS